MKKTTNEKLINWIQEKVKKEWPDDISLVVLYGSFINGTAKWITVQSKPCFTGKIVLL